MTNMSDMFWILVAVAFFVPKVAENKQCSENPCFCCKSGSCEDPASHPYPCRGCVSGRTGSSCHEPCPETCVNCSQLYFEFETDKICYQCKSGYYNGRYKDVPTYPLLQDCSLSCQIGCESCSSFNNCTNCKASFFMDSRSECRECPENCYQCTSEKSCNLCRDNHVWNGHFCQQCKPNCKMCSVNGECTECNSEYYVFGGECLRCQSGCQTCNDKNVCTECKTGFYIQSNKCIACKDNCLTCALNYDLGYTCRECVEGFYKLNEDCEKCPSGCATCDTSTSCKNCDRYHKLHGGVCYECPASCTACSDNNICISCTERHYYYNGKCLSCREQCASCRSLDTCLLCVNGYFGNLCSSQCPIYCTNNFCNKSTGDCIGCVDGYFKDADRNCKKCPEHCSVCDSYKYCLECDTGYMGIYCEEKCRNCKPGTKCEKSSGYCFDGCRKGLTGKSCDKLCESKCLSCDRSNPSKCQACAVDRYGSACMNLCSDKCFNITCNDIDGVCTHGCISGYWGRKCELNCTDNCTANGCLRSNGTCLHKSSETFSDEIQPDGMSVVLIVLLISAGAIILSALFIFGICMCKHQQKKKYEALSQADPECTPDEESESARRINEGLLNFVECEPDSNTNEKFILLEKSSSDHIKVDVSVTDEKSEFSQNTSRTNMHTEEKSAESTEADMSVTVGESGSVGNTSTPTDKNAADSSEDIPLRPARPVTQRRKSLRKVGKNNEITIPEANQLSLPAKYPKEPNVVDGKSQVGSDMEDSSEESTLEKHEKQRTENHLNAFGQLNMESETYTYMKGKGESNGKIQSDNRKKSMSTENKETKEKICETNEKELNTRKLEKSGNNDLHGIDKIENIRAGKKAMNETIKTAESVTHLKENKKKNNLSNGSETTAEGRKETKLDMLEEEKDLTDNEEQHAPIRIRKDDNFTNKKEKEIADENSKSEESVDNNSNVNKLYGTELKEHTKTRSNQKETVGSKTKTENYSLNTSVKKENGTNDESSPKVSEEKEMQTNEKEKTKLNENVGPEFRQQKINRELLSDDKSISGLDAALQEVIQAKHASSDMSCASQNSSQSGSIDDFQDAYTDMPVEDSTKNDTAVTETTRIHIDRLAEEYRARDILKEFKQLQTISEKKDIVIKKVDGAPESIDAVYVDGFPKEMEYIVSLEPKFQNTTDIAQLWDMIWHNDCGKIIVLNSNSEPSGRHRYWSETRRTQKNVNIGDFRVRVSDKRITKTDLTLTLSKAKKEVQLFEFSAWPDIENTQGSSKLIAFWKEFKSTVPTPDGRTLVQCRKDIGSTGVFVAFDILAGEALLKEHVDIFECVKKLRQQCPAMFQTEEQYRTLYEVMIVYSQTKQSCSSDETDN